MNEKWMSLTLDEVEQKLNTNAASGLSRKAARSRRQKAGENAFFLLPHAKVVDCIREVMTQPSVVLLLVLGILLLFFEQSTQGRTLLWLTVLYALMLVAARLWAGRVNLRSARTSRPLIRVIREGQMYLLDCARLVPGDLIELESGDTVPCDLRLVSAENLRVLTYLGANKGEGSYIRTLKDAAHICTPREQNDITLHANMLYGGSVIEQGNARALVVATGKHTYIGALQGGFPLTGVPKLPESVSRLKAVASRLQIALLLAIVPLLCLCLVIGKNQEGLPLLFSTLLCLCLANLVGNMETLLLFGMSLGIHRAAGTRTSETALIKTEHNPDMIGLFDTLLLLGKHAFSDGMSHITDICLPDVIPEVHKKDREADRRKIELLTLTYAYGQGILSVPSAVSANQADLSSCIQEYLQKHRINLCTADLRIIGFSQLGDDIAEFTLNNRHVAMAFREDVTSLSALTHARCRDGIRRIDSTMSTQLNAYLSRAEQAGNTFRLLATRENGLWVLEGILTLSETFLSTREHALDQLRDAGITPVLFLEATSANVAYALRTGIIHATSEIAVASHFRAQNLPITANWGKYHVYCGFSNEQLTELVRFIKKNGKQVAILANSPQEYHILRDADVRFAASDELDLFLSRGTKREQQPRVSRGREDAAAQRVRRRADVLIPRADRQHGGIASIVHAMYTVSHIRRNLSDLVRYLLYTQLVRMTLVLPTMLAGINIMQPTQVLFSGLFVDILFALLLILRVRKQDPKELRDNRERHTWKHTIVEAIFAGTLTLISFLFIYRNYPDESSAVTALFLALLLIQLTVFLLHMDLRNSLRLAANRRILLAALCIVLLFFLVAAMFGGLPHLGFLAVAAPYGYVALIGPLAVILVTVVVRLYLLGRFH